MQCALDVLAVEAEELIRAPVKRCAGVRAGIEVAVNALVAAHQEYFCAGFVTEWDEPAAAIGYVVKMAQGERCILCSHERR